MTRNIMTHDEAREMLEALALDALDTFESAAALAHVAGCSACTDALAALRQAAEQLAYASAPVPMLPAQSARVRGRLLARASADGTQSASAARSVTVEPALVRSIGAGRAARRRAALDPLMWGAIAAGVIAVVSALAALSERRGRDEARDAAQVARAQELSHRAALDSLSAIVADRDQLIANLTGPQVAVMSLAATTPRSPSARMFWDQRHDAWTFVAHNLRMPSQGRVYQLWLVTPSAKISAGMFMPRVDGDAVVRATYKLDPGALAAVAVTDEPTGGSAQPTTSPMLAVTSGR
jgi:hypothetical protein